MVHFPYAHSPFGYGMGGLGILEVRLSSIAVLFSTASLFAYHLGFSAPYSIPKLAVLAAGVAVMAVAIIGGAQVDYGRPLMANGAAMILICAVSAIFANDKWLALAGNYNSYSLGLMGVLIAFCYHVAAASGGHGAGVLPLAGAILGLHAFAQWSGFDSEISSRITGNRAISTVGSPVFLGTVLGVLLPLTVEKSWAYAIAVSIGLFSTGSRGAWIAAVVGLLAYGLSSGKRKISYIAISIGIVAFLFYGNRPYSKSDTERIETWKVAIKTISVNPVLGVGPDGFGNSYRLYRSADAGQHVAEDAHNDILQAAATMGCLGLLAYLCLAFMSIASVSGPAIGSVVSAFVNAKVNPIPLEVMILLAVIVGLYSKRPSQKNILPYPACAILGILAIVLIAAASRIVLADRLSKAGDIASLSRACELNPFELTYKTSLVNRGLNEMASPNSVEWKDRVLGIMRRESNRAITLRSAASTSWHIAAFVSRIENKLGLGGDPSIYLSRAIGLEPRSEQLIMLAKRL